jgi:hypothetical protein
MENRKKITELLTCFVRHIVKVNIEITSNPQIIMNQWSEEFKQMGKLNEKCGCTARRSVN